MRVALQEREGAERSSSSSSLAKALADAESLLLSPIKTATSQDKKATDARSIFDRSATGGVPPSPSLSKALEEAESLLLADAQSKSSTAAQSAGQSAAAASKSASAPKVNPEATRSVSARKTTKSYTCVQKCLVRAGWQLDSASLGFLTAGEAVDAVSERVLGTGQTRVAFAFSGSRPASGDSATATPSRDDSGFEAVAWVSVKSSSGVTCLAEAKASSSPRTIPFLRDKSAALTEWIADGKDMLRFLTVHTKARCESTVVGQVLQQQRFMAQVLSSKESHGETWLGLKLGDMDVAILAATQTKEVSQSTPSSESEPQACVHMRLPARPPAGTVASAQVALRVQDTSPRL